MSHKCGGPSCYRTQGRRSECPSCSSRMRRLRNAFKALPKTDHGEVYLERHPDVRSEWVMMVIEDPYEEWTEGDDTSHLYTIITGRVRERNQWIQVVFQGNTPETRMFDTTYFNRQLAKKYGGRPWSSDLPMSKNQ